MAPFFLSGCLDKKVPELKGSPKVPNMELRFELKKDPQISSATTRSLKIEEVIRLYDDYYKSMGLANGIPMEARRALDFSIMFVQEYHGDSVSKFHDYLGLSLRHIKQQLFSKRDSGKQVSRWPFDFIFVARLMRILVISDYENKTDGFRQHVLGHIISALNLAPRSNTLPMLLLKINAAVDFYTNRVKPPASDAIERAYEMVSEMYLEGSLVLSLEDVFDKSMLHTISHLHTLCTSKAHIRAGDEHCKAGFEAYMAGFKLFEEKGDFEAGRSEFFNAWLQLEELKRVENSGWLDDFGAD